MIQTQTGRSNKRKREIQRELLADIEAGTNEERKIKKKNRGKEMKEKKERNMDMQGTPKMEIWTCKVHQKWKYVHARYTKNENMDMQSTPKMKIWTCKVHQK